MNGPNLLLGIVAGAALGYAWHAWRKARSLERRITYLIHANQHCAWSIWRICQHVGAPVRRPPYPDPFEVTEPEPPP